MLMSKLCLGIILSSFFIGIFGRELYEQVSHACKSVSPGIYRKYLNGTAYKTNDIIFMYKRSNEHDNQCDGHVYLSIDSQSPFSSDEIQSIVQDFSFNDRLVDVFGKIDVSENEELQKKFDQCKAVLENDELSAIDSLNCLRLVWCREYDFSIPETVGSIAKHEIESRKVTAFNKHIQDEITCNSNASTFSKVTSSLLDKINRDIDSRLSSKIPLPAVSTDRVFAPYGNFIFTEKLKRDKSWITITASPHQNYQQVGLEFNYNIPKAKIEYFDVEQSNGSFSEVKNYCVVLHDMPVLMNLTMNFQETYCKTFIQKHKMYLHLSTMRHCDTDEILSSEDPIVQFIENELFGDVSKIVLMEISSLAKRNINEIINCKNFRLGRSQFINNI